MADNTMAGFRLSAQQERVWAGQQGGTGAPYCAQVAVRLEGTIDSSILQESVGRVVQRFEILRTVFHRQPGLKVPFQVILESSEPAWETVDLTGMSESAQNDQIERHLRQHAHFDFERGPLLRVLLATSGPGQHILVLSLPALSADSRSLQNLIGEIGRSYASALAGAETEGDVMQYADVVQWQSELLESDDTKAGRDFWRDYCRKLDLTSLAAISLPCESRIEASAFEPQVLVSEVNSELTRRLDAICSEKSVSAAEALLACWNILLCRLTGQRDITVGFELDGRKYQELEDALGLFAKYVPLQGSVEPELSFASVLQQVTNSVAEAGKWQESFTWGQIEASADSVGPALPFAFDYVELSSEQRYGTVGFTVERQWVCHERFRLKLSGVRRPSGLQLEWHYDAARLEAAAVERLAGYFQTLLPAALANPETPVSRLPLLSPAERQQLLTEWNQTAAACPEQCLHQLFEAQAARTPERPALRFQQHQLSYREFNEQSNQLAHYLRSLGVGADSLVGLCVERSAQMMVALLAILKAGGAYVPLNPDNPKPRLAQQLAGARVLITETKLAAQMPEFAGQTLGLDRDQEQWRSQPLSNPAVNTTPENLVYVIYTSGSTGVPKGVAVRHRNLVNYTTFLAHRLELDQHPEGLHFATVSTLGADLGNTCIYPALVSGGCLHVIPYEVSTDAQRFAAYAQQYPIDVLKIVPSHLQALLHGSEARQVLPRRYLITGGETLTSKLLEKIDTLNPTCQILNHYGPTETTVGSLTLRLHEYDWKHAAAASIPIGRPIANTQVYILDGQQQPVPVGVVGELYIAGAGVTAGYLNQPERTAERFLPNPFSPDPNARMYCTGDLARYQSDGNVEFLGRGDDQVKIRGFRIELGEIEAVLGKRAGVKQAVVLAQEDAGGDKRLVAYVVSDREPATTSEQLRAYLKEQLPDYMVPAAIALLPKLPLTANGKLDRQALPAPEQLQTRVYVAPKTPTEEAVASIWAEVLRRPQISTQDNFFDLGGHSLLATQVISRVRRALNVDLPLRTLFESPTVEQIAQQIDKGRGDLALPRIPPITRVSRDQALPLSFAQQRLWVLDRMEPNNPLYNIPRRLRMHGALNVDALTRALNEIVRRHESQRTTFTARNGQPVQLIARSLTISVLVRDLTTLAEDQRENEARRMAAEEALTPFDLATGPLLRATLLRLTAGDHILLLTLHHIVSDAWSAAVFFQEFSALYEAFTNGQASPLPDLPVQYADYAAWQREWFQGEVLRDQLAYWREHLKGAPAVLQLPTDRPRPKMQSFRGDYESVPLSRELSNRLRQFSQQQGATLFMTLLAGFNALLSRYSGQEQIVLGTDVANRATTETERMIGFFINLLALRTDLSGDPTFHELLERVREVALGAYAHQDMPFDKLVEELQPERSLSHNPLVQALFVMQNIPRQKRELAGLKLTPFELPITRSKFDLAVFMVDGDDGLVSNWLYSTDLFERSTILRIAGHFETLLGSAAAQPDARLSTLEMLTGEEKQQQGAEKKQRKQSQLKKLMTIEPKAVSLPEADRSKK